MLKKIAFAGVGILLLASPLVASADVLSDLQAQVQALQAQLQALLSPQGGVSNPYVDETMPLPETPPYCPTLTVNMYRGSRDTSTGGQVSELQRFLASRYDLNEEDIVTGFFGRLTEANVIKFQQATGLPSFGIAGSLTRAKIAEVCGGSTAPSASIESGSAYESQPFSLSGSASNVRRLTAIVVENEYAGPTDWNNVGNLLKGGGSFNAVSQDTLVSEGRWSARFGGLARGTYAVLVYDSSCAISNSQICPPSLSLLATGGLEVAESSSGIFSVVPATGIAPLTVTISIPQSICDGSLHYLYYGDGGRTDLGACTPDGTYVAHYTNTYPAAGVYPLYITDSATPGAGRVLAQASVTVASRAVTLNISEPFALQTFYIDSAIPIRWAAENTPPGSMMYVSLMAQDGTIVKSQKVDLGKGDIGTLMEIFRNCNGLFSDAIDADCTTLKKFVSGGETTFTVRGVVNSSSGPDPLAMDDSAPFQIKNRITAGEGKMIILTSGDHWTIPVDWNILSNTVEVIGGGGGGGGGSSSYSGAGAGAGAYAKMTNLPLVPGESIPYHIGEGGNGGATGGGTGGDGDDTYFAGVVCNASAVCAKGGKGVGQHPRKGGQASEGTGAVKYSGGDGAYAQSPTQAGGGGGAAGPNGGGFNGGPGFGGSGDGGAGGAGGTNGKGGDPGAEWVLADGSRVGAGGGGSGGSGNPGSGGAGGNYGAGGGGGTGPSGSTSFGEGGDGAKGIVVITYTPLLTLNSPSASLIQTSNLANVLTALEGALKKILELLK